MDQQDRLGRIEQKIDKLTDAMIEFSRAEQKIDNVERAQKTAHDRMNKHSEELDRIRDQQIKNTQTIQTITFITGAIFTGLVTVALKMFLG